MHRPAAPFANTNEKTAVWVDSLEPFLSTFPNGANLTPHTPHPTPHTPRYMKEVLCLWRWGRKAAADAGVADVDVASVASVADVADVAQGKLQLKPRWGRCRWKDADYAELQSAGCCAQCAADAAAQMLLRLKLRCCRCRWSGLSLMPRWWAAAVLLDCTFAQLQILSRSLKWLGSAFLSNRTPSPP
jgi:hypothetical protein